jgi:hypothetical protein
LFAKDLNMTTNEERPKHAIIKFTLKCQAQRWLGFGLNETFLYI